MAVDITVRALRTKAAPWVRRSFVSRSLNFPNLGSACMHGLSSRRQRQHTGPACRVHLSASQMSCVTHVGCCAWTVVGRTEFVIVV